MIPVNQVRPISHAAAIIGAMGLATVVSHGLARTTLPLLLPAIETELLSNRQQSGLLGSSGFVAYLAGVGFVTAFSGRLEPVTILRSGLAVATVGFVVLSQANSLAGLAVGQALAGGGSAGIWMAAPTIAGAAARPSRRGLAMGVLSSSMGLGLLFIGQGTNAARSITGNELLWRPVWVVAAGFTGALLIVILAGLRVPSTEPSAGGISLARLRTVPRWLALTTAYWIFGLVSSSFAPFFGLLLKDQGFSAGHITNLFSLLGLAAAIGPINLGRLSDRVGRRPILGASHLALGIAAVLALTGREPWVTVSITLFGAASFTFPVLVVAYLGDHLTGRAFSNALGAVTLFFASALIIGPTAAGAIADGPGGIEAVFVLLAILSVVATTVIARLPGPTREPVRSPT